VERRTYLTKIFTIIIIALLITTTIMSYNFATKISWHKHECARLGGVIVHGTGIGLCVKMDNVTNE
jgi:hypothetical protein